jgi:hypothetical protein
MRRQSVALAEAPDLRGTSVFVRACRPCEDALVCSCRPVWVTQSACDPCTGRPFSFVCCGVAVDKLVWAPDWHARVDFPSASATVLVAVKVCVVCTHGALLYACMLVVLLCCMELRPGSTTAQAGTLWFFVQVSVQHIHALQDRGMGWTRSGVGALGCRLSA